MSNCSGRRSSAEISIFASALIVFLFSVPSHAQTGQIGDGDCAQASISTSSPAAPPTIGKVADPREVRGPIELSVKPTGLHHGQFSPVRTEGYFTVGNRKEKVERPDKNDDDPAAKLTEEKFHWKPALVQSGIMLGVQHAFRLTQDKTQRQLGGSFIGEWSQSVKNLRGWHDGDSLFINYVAHPLQGATTGRIFVNNSDKAKKQEFGRTKEYWLSRTKALGWSAVWSTQFELGPVSEASIGNVGKNDHVGRSGMAWGDLVVTPILGTGLLIAEDAIDKYILKNWFERNARTRRVRILRSFLTPTMSVSNILRGKPPWKRDNRK